MSIFMTYATFTTYMPRVDRYLAWRAAAARRARLRHSPAAHLYIALRLPASVPKQCHSTASTSLPAIPASMVSPTLTCSMALSWCGRQGSVSLPTSL